ncbi:DUF4401 domain-containing protein [Hahella ganghwensis]|uniref:DUF4401 domain-containing protein n=1 Tax=Hahella ganghwensis TaxID=286420 RepID=UPI00037AD583|nr:DUF4401 domain-containing protein [Hahella ganghwensis]
MNTTPRTMQDLFRQLSSQGLHQDLSTEQERKLVEVFEADTLQPWYIRALIGIGAWLSSWLFMAFIIGISISLTESLYWVLGVLFLAAAIGTCHVTRVDFLRHMALAMSLAGQLLIGYAIAETSPWDDIESSLLALIALNLILIVGFPDRIHRFLSILFINSALAPLLYKWEAQAMIPFISPLLLGAFAFISLRETQWNNRAIAPLIPSLTAGLAISAMGWTLLSTIYVLPELQGDFVFYPTPWITTLGALITLCLVQWKYLPLIPGNLTRNSILILIAGTVLLALTTLNAPGIMLSLTVILIGSLNSHRFQQGMGIGFLSLFLLTFFYGIETSLLMKSAILTSAGVLVLLVRWTLQKSSANALPGE